MEWQTVVVILGFLMFIHASISELLGERSGYKQGYWDGYEDGYWSK